MNAFVVVVFFFNEHSGSRHQNPKNKLVHSGHFRRFIQAQRTFDAHCVFIRCRCRLKNVKYPPVAERLSLIGSPEWEVIEPLANTTRAPMMRD